jgi:tetratricopeptide (TPR) repeat protein
MPHTINGIGTWYYGKDNVVTRNDRCEFCGKYGELKSYDTTLYFVVVFIPLIPMGRKRIIDQCPSCRRHRAAKLSEWEKRKADVILEKTQAWQADRGNKEKAFAALGSTIGFSDRESFKQLAPVVDDAFKRDADAQIFLGDAYDHFGDYATAESAFRAAMANRPDEDSREALARFFIRRTRPADAAPLLAHIVPHRKRDRAGHLLALAETYQAVGDHESAFQIVDETGTAFADLLSDPAYERVRRSVTKYRGTNKIIKSAGLKGAGREGAGGRTSWLARNSGFALLGAVALIAFAIYLSMAFARGKHTVILVNGTPQPYSVDINGRKFPIPALGHRSVELAEGTLRVSVPDRAGKIEPATLDMRTSFWRRPFNKRVMVINPDRIGVVYWEQTEYGDTHSGSREHDRYYVGDVLYNLDSVDYVFEPFPHSISGDDNTKSIKKTRLDMVREAGAEFPTGLKEVAGEAAAKQWARRFAVLSDDEKEGLGAVADILTPAEQIDFIRAHLADRPIRINWHRAYQELVTHEQPAYDVTAEYKGMLAKEPNDPSLMYLVARTLNDGDEAAAMFRKAGESSPPCAFAWYGLWYDAMSLGDFDRALSHIRAARKISPDEAGFGAAEAETLTALGKPAEAQALVASLDKGPEPDRETLIREIHLLVAKGDVPAARTRIDQFCTHLSTKYHAPPEAVARVRSNLEVALYYSIGDASAYHKAVAAATDKTGYAQLQLALFDAQPEAAQKALAAIETAQPLEYMLVFVCAANKGNATIADPAWAKAVELMKSKGPRRERVFAAELAKASPPSDQSLRNWAAEPLERAIVLTALGLKYPQKRADYFAMARKLNYSNRSPSRLIAQVTK